VLENTIAVPSGDHVGWESPGGGGTEIPPRATPASEAKASVTSASRIFTV